MSDGRGRLTRGRLSRRRFLQGIAAATLSGCRSSPSRPPIGGSIVGGNHSRGHLLRDGLPELAVRSAERGPTERTGVAIIGGGIAGLSAAWTLERAGYRDYRVLELDALVGGTARSGIGPVTPYPWGAHYVPVPPADDRPMQALLREIGAIVGEDAAGRPVYAEQMLCREPTERVFYRGEWYEGLYPRVAMSATDADELERFEAEMRRWAGWRDGDGRRAFALPRARGSDAAEVRALDGMSMADYLAAKGWGSERLRWFVEYACRDDFGSTLGQTSAWAGIHYFAARLEDAEAEPAPFLTWPEGNGRLVAHLASVVGARLDTDALVAEVRGSDDGAVTVLWLDADGEPRQLQAEHAIVATPSFIAQRIVAGPNATSPAARGAPGARGLPQYGPWMVANLTLRGRPAERGFPLAWDNVLYDSPSLGYVTATHQTGSDHGPTVLTYYLPVLDDDPRRARERMLRTPWRVWVDQIRADLGRAHRDLDELLERVDVHLWGHAMVRPSPGYLWSEALAARARPAGRIHFAHTELSGMALFEEAQYHGIRAAEAVLRTAGHPHIPWFEGQSR